MVVAVVCFLNVPMFPFALSAADRSPLQKLSRAAHKSGSGLLENGRTKSPRFQLWPRETRIRKMFSGLFSNRHFPCFFSEFSFVVPRCTRGVVYTVEQRILGQFGWVCFTELNHDLRV